jgi:Trk K+ transport system NAD-binding subunit
MLPSSKSTYQTTNGSHGDQRFLICGLGSVGQHCVAVLKQYGVTVSAIEEIQPRDWEIPDLPNLLAELLIGDCRQSSVLNQAKVQQCRSVLLVTSDERVNIEAAFAARLLNPQIRLIVRSDKQNLNELLGQNLGNFVAYEPTQLSASAFALAAIGAETLGYFNLEGQLLRVLKYQIQPGDRWCDRWLVHGLNNATRQVLSHTTDPSHLPKFYQWEPEAKLQAGDTIVYIEVTDKHASHSQQSANDSKLDLRQLWQGIVRGLSWKNLKQKMAKVWQSTDQYQTQRVAMLCGITILILLFCGTILFCLEYPGISLREAFSATAALLLGGYGDLFGEVKLTAPIPWWLQMFSLGLTLAGTAFVGVLYALLTETLLTSKFQLFPSRPPVPQQDHVVLIGLGWLGQQVAALLQELKQPLVGITSTALAPSILPQMPLFVGDIANALTKVNLSNAKSIIVVTDDDDMVNLEIGLMAHTANPTTGLVIRTYDRYFSDNVARLFPYAQVLCASALSAEVFTAAAFGEKVLNLFHFNNQTVLVTEYSIEAGDTLNGLILAEVAYGYGVVPILYQHYTQEPPQLMPSDHTRLYVGDRLIVLATSSSLQRIERGEMAPRRWQVQIEKALNRDAIDDGADEIALISGCSIGTARELMNHLPRMLRRPLYKHQAQRLVRELSSVKVLARLIFIADDTKSNRPNTSNFSD